MAVIEPVFPGMAVDVDVDQWRVESIQMVNWGGFEGHHKADLNLDSILITGASGTGKSTLLDAYIALMMDSNTPFNGASNDNVIGRARSSDQRNVLSYVRGKVNTSRDTETGMARDEVLRGEGYSTWSGLAATWVNDDSARLTAMRLYFAPASATHSREVRTHMAIFPGDFDLRSVEQFARTAPAFHHTRMTTQFPRITFHESYAKFAAALHKRLGIGKNGDGASALKLLARIQGGRQVASVDGLYKDMVLERPRTYTAADRAIEHFEVLESSYDTMQTAQQQADTLRGIPSAHDDLVRAETEADLIDTFNVSEPADADTPLTLWANRTEADLLSAEIQDNRQAWRRASDARATAEKDKATSEYEIQENQRHQRENGGDAVAKIEQDLTHLILAVTDVETARSKFAARTAALDTTPVTAEQFETLAANSADFLGGYEALVSEHEDRVQEHAEKVVPLRNEHKSLETEKAWLEQRGDLIPQQLHETRVAIADAVGMDAEDLPFVAELIDLQPEHEQWREAAELLLGGFARTMLVDKSVGRQFRIRLNALRLPIRINYDLADLHQAHRTLDTATLPGRFLYKEGSAFVGWLQAQLERRFSHECVTDATRFQDDNRKRITQAGQVQNGSRGAHGGHGARHILGFSNKRRLAEVEARLTVVGGQLTDLSAEGRSLTAVRTSLDNLHSAHQYVLDTPWDSIDITAARTRVSEKESERDRLLAASDILTTLKSREQDLKKQLDDATKRYHLADAAVDALDKEWATLTDREDTVKDRLEMLEDNPHVSLTEAQTQRLNDEYDKVAATRAASEFAKALGKVRQALSHQVSQARRDVQTHTATLTNAFTMFQQRWPRPNLGVSVASYSGYRTILDDLVAEGLGERREQFTQRVIEWSGEDLLGLHRSYAEAFEEIEYRLIPVNDILAGLAFGPQRDRLKINLRMLKGDDVKQFRSELKTLASGTTLLVTPDAVESRFSQLRRFIKRIRKADSGSSERDHLLDVRRHVHIEAERLDARTGEQRGIYDSLGGKSGGETQELIAFIVGAALRYQLGNENRPRPIYAPVFLDEGFVKSDSEFAGRAVDAWRGLGFQLIVGAPLDKVTAIEPYMDRLIQVTKSISGYSHLRHVNPATPARHVERVS